MSLGFAYGAKTVQEFTHLFEHGELNLTPGFQRESVWTSLDRRKLIQSILQHYPIPSVFLYRQEDSQSGHVRYDVIDGKQRLETVLMFQGAKSFGRQRFAVKLRLDDAEEEREWNWKRLRDQGYGVRLTGYEIQTVEVWGEFNDIVDLFIRLNSTGKKLTGAEKRHAKFFRTEFLKQAAKLAARREHFFRENHILTSGQISRMKHVELVSELMASIHSKVLIDKKKALDAIIEGWSVDRRSLSRVIRETIRVMNLTIKMFPGLKTTRFARSADFYSLFMCVWEMDQEGHVLSDRKRNKQAEKLLTWLSDGVALVREQQRKAKGAATDQRLFADYLLTVQGDTDSRATRQRRAGILKRVFGGIFEKKDDRRCFTPEQRALLWHSAGQERCLKCGARLTWANFTIDHIKPYVLGGKTTLSNAALMCRSCNSRKGKR